MSTETRPQIPTGWYDPAVCDLQELADLVEQTTEPSEYPHAEEVVQGVLVYGAALREAVAEPQTRRTAQAELARALAEGPGIVLFRGAVVGDAVDAASAVFTRLIDEQRGRGYASGDHFAKPGANDRLWGALDKLAVADPEVFAAYYSNDVLALVSEAWLGPRYQVTSQVNVVNPGGEAQVAHRDYHLGFMDLDQAQSYPAQAHALSPARDRCLASLQPDGADPRALPEHRPPRGSREPGGKERCTSGVGRQHADSGTDPAERLWCPAL